MNIKPRLNLNKQNRTIEKSVEKIDGIEYAVTTLTTVEKRYVKLDAYKTSVDTQIQKLQADKLAVATLAEEVIK